MIKIKQKLQTAIWTVVLFSGIALQSNAMTEITDAEMSKIDGQSDAIGVVISDFSLNENGTDTGKISLNFNSVADSELSISEIQMIRQGGGHINIGTPGDPIIIGDLIDMGNISVMRFAMPLEPEHYTSMRLSMLLTNKYYLDHLMRVTLAGFKPWAHRRDINGNINGSVPSDLFVWSAGSQGLSIAGNVSLTADKIELQASQNDSFKGEISLNEVEMRLVLGHPHGPGLAILNHPYVFKTFDKNGDLGFSVEMIPANPNSNALGLGYFHVKSMTVPGKNGPQTLKSAVDPNQNFINVTGLEIQGFKMTTTP